MTQVCSRRLRTHRTIQVPSASGVTNQQQQASVMAATQRPVTEAALAEAAGAPAWKSIPSWFIYGSADRNIPAAVQGFMAERARARKVVEIEGASHVVMISQPEALARIIYEATDTVLPRK